MSEIPETIRRWHVIALERRAEELKDILAEDCVFESPVVHTPQKGRAIVEAYLRGALEVLNTEHFRYGGEWYGRDSAVLEFFSEVDGITINGVDIIGWGADGRITSFKVMVRPSTSPAPPKRRCQSPYEITTSPSLPAVSFSAVNSRPRIGLTCMTSKKSAVACAPLNRSGSPLPVRFIPLDQVNIARLSNDWLCAFQST